MPTIRNRFYPLADTNQHEEISLYSTLVTGLGGTLVKIVTGSCNPQNADGWAINSSVGIAVANTISQRYETKFKVTPTVSGDTKYSVLGLTLLSTLEYDENGIPLRYNDERAREIGAVRSGETTPIITKSTLIGIWGQYIDQSSSPIQPSFLAVISNSGNGLLASVDPTNAAVFSASPTGSAVNAIYKSNQVVGKWLTSLPTATNTGLQNEFSAQGGYALLQFNAIV